VFAEANKALVRRFFEAQAGGDLHALDEMMASDFVDRSLLPGEEPHREGYMRSVTNDHAAFSDIRYIIEDQLAVDDKVVSRITINRIHDREEFVGIAPTGREFESTAIVIHRISDGKIVEEWSEGSGVQELTQRRLEQQELENERIAQELRVARRIQQALLPKAAPRLEDWAIFRHYQPAQEVGGDFYDFHPLSDGHVGFVIGDVSGKGVPAAVMMANTQSVLRAVAQRGGSAPGQVLAEANEVLYTYVPPHTFVTCFYAILEPQSGRFRYANAGHNLPCCRRHEGPVTELRAKGMPLGLMSEMSYEEKETNLVPEDSVLFYSDGLVEARNPQGVIFSTPRLRNLLAGYPTRGTALTRFLLEELERFTGEAWEQEDDITLVTLERLARGTPPSR
jgi:serine phosphatase RsbU (regulator of sigma subunit)/predicted ester cyclase